MKALITDIFKESDEGNTGVTLMLTNLGFCVWIVL